jgi:hypothetical protein
VGAVEVVKFGNVEREIFIAEAGAGVIHVGEVGGGRERVRAYKSMGSKGAIEFCEEQFCGG